MQLDEVVQRIFRMMLPFTTSDMPPIAYISLEAGNEFPYTNEQLTEAYNNIKWDSVLSSSELFILRKPKSYNEDTGLILGGFSLFNDDVNGEIDENGSIPTFCFVGKHIC